MSNAIKLTPQQRAMLRACTGLDEVTIRKIYERPDAGVREASYLRAWDGAKQAGVPLPPPRGDR